MNSIKSILDTILSANPFIPKWHYVLFSEWNSIADNLKHELTILKINGDTLIVGVYDVHLIYQLHIISNSIIQSINKKLNSNYINNIIFRHTKKIRNPL